MKKLLGLTIVGLIFLTGCQSGDIMFTIKNPLDIERQGEIIKLTHEQVSEWLAIPADLSPLILDKDGTPLPTQSDDLDGDGTWDEIVVLLDIGPLESKQLSLSFIKESEFPEFKDRTNVRLGANEKGYPELTMADRLEGVSYANHGLTGEAYQMEGPAWENDKVGFRNYLDQRNGLDIFGKLTTEMVLDSVGIAGRGSYHEPDEWGMDILKVGTSLGAGGIGYFSNDSIFRIGDNGKGSYKLVVDGHLRSMFQLDFNQWQIGEHTIDVMQLIEIRAGSYCYASSVTYSGEELTVDLVTGIVNMKSDMLYTEKLNEQYTALYTHDLQSEDTTLLGMALMVENDLLIESGETKDSGEGITQTYFAKLKAGSGQPVTFRFYSFWEKENAEWKDPVNFINIMKKDADHLSNPLMIE